MKNLILQKCIHILGELIITAFPQQLYRGPGQSILTLWSFLRNCHFDDTVRQNRQAHYTPHRAACYSLTHLGRDCVAGAKKSPSQWDLSWEVKSSSGNINSSTSVKGTCWFNTFLSTGEYGLMINGLLLMQNDNTVQCSTIDARICGLCRDFNYQRNNFFSTCKGGMTCKLNCCSLAGA